MPDTHCNYETGTGETVGTVSVRLTHKFALSLSLSLEIIDFVPGRDLTI